MVDGRTPETKEKERETFDTVSILVIVYTCSSAMCRRSFRRRFAYAKRFLFV